MRAGRHAVARALVLCVVGALFVACGNGNGQPSAQNMSVEDPSLVTVTDTGERAFSATLVNNNKKKVSIAQVSVALFDQGGTRVGTTTIEVEDIKAGESKKFSGPLDTDAAVAQAQVQSVMIP
jgi:copper(I)-binding protein